MVTHLSFEPIFRTYRMLRWSEAYSQPDISAKDALEFQVIAHYATKRGNVSDMLSPGSP
jgi:hypothetical protein